MIKNLIIAVLSVLVLVLGFFALNYFIYYEKQGSGMEAAMHDMTADLDGKTGSELDRAFLEGMIVHHEGAVAMAQAVRANGSRPELKAMAEAIITAQTAEIAQMKAWLSAWYGTTEPHNGHAQ